MSVRLLVVDDSTWVREGLRFMMTSDGLELVDASTCRAATLQWQVAGLGQ